MYCIATYCAKVYDGVKRQKSCHTRRPVNIRPDRVRLFCLTDPGWSMSLGPASPAVLGVTGHRPSVSLRRHHPGGRRRVTATRFRGSMPTTSGWCTPILLGRVPRRDVDDLVQDVFITAYTRIRELREPAAFGGWIATIARNRATDYLRQSPRAGRAAGRAAGRRCDRGRDVRRARSDPRLPEAYRETLLMRLVEGMSGRRSPTAPAAPARCASTCTAG